MSVLDTIIDRISNDPEAVRLLNEVQRTKASHDEAVKRFRQYMGEPEPREAKTGKPAENTEWEDKVPTSGQSVSIAARAYDLIFDAGGAILTNADLGKALGLEEIQIGQGLKPLVRLGLIKKPLRGAYQWAGPRRLPESGTMEDKILQFLIGSGPQTQSTIWEGIGSPALPEFLKTFRTMRSTYWVVSAGQKTWRVHDSVVKNPRMNFEPERVAPQQ
jgi:hypothetical protein